MKSFYLAEHQGKGRAYAAALEQAGYRQAARMDDPDLALALFDHDVGAKGTNPREGLEYLRQRGVAVFMYPHAARPMLQWDGMYPVWPHSRCNIVIGPGHREVMDAYGYPLPIEVCGWTMCELRPFERSVVEDRPVEVLFAPIHPNHNGYLHPVDRAKNTLVYQLLLRTPGIHLTVRHIMRLDISGLWSAPNVRYILANPNGSTAEIDQADLIVAHQTFAFLAVARGKPLVMFGDDLRAHSGNTPDNLRWAASYETYQERMRYPVEMECARTPVAARRMIELAIGTDAGAGWRKRFIGKAFDPGKFIKTIEKYL